MIPLHVTDEQIQALRYERFHPPHPRVQNKMEVLFLRASGLSVSDVCKLADVSPNTYRSYLREFQQGGIEGLKRFDGTGTFSNLDSHADTIIDSLVEQPVRTLAHARQKINELTRVERSNEQVRQFFRRHGFKPLKVGSMPAQADPEAQADFKKKLDPRLDQADRGKRMIYFVDASHFVYGGVLGVLWTAMRMLIPTGSGDGND